MVLNTFENISLKLSILFPLLRFYRNLQCHLQIRLTFWCKNLDSCVRFICHTCRMMLDLTGWGRNILDQIWSPTNLACQFAKLNDVKSVCDIHLTFSWFLKTQILQNLIQTHIHPDKRDFQNVYKTDNAVFYQNFKNHGFDRFAKLDISRFNVF